MREYFVAACAHSLCLPKEGVTFKAPSDKNNSVGKGLNENGKNYFLGCLWMGRTKCKRNG